MNAAENPPSAPEGSAPSAAAPPAGAPRGSQLLRAVAVMEALRSPQGDAWTHRQTHASLARYLLEETHEVLEVIDDPVSRGSRALVDELGDLLFQILFHARLGQEAADPWDVDDVARAFVEKMERRNPHVFGEGAEDALEDPQDVEAIIAQWHAVKAAERPDPRPDTAGPTWFEGIPAQVPALQTAAKAVHRARSEGRLDDLLESADEVARAEDAEQWGGDLSRALLDIVVAAEALDADPEAALRALLRRVRSASSHPAGDQDGPGDPTA